MKKKFNLYIVAWALLLGLFNLCVFIVPAWPNIEKYTPSFWIGYIITTIAFIGQLACTWMAVKDDKIKKIFYNISLISVSYAALIGTVSVALIFMVITPLPYWIAAIGCSLVLVANVVAVLKAKTAIDIVESVDAKVEQATSFICSMRVDSENLIARASASDIQDMCKKVRDAFKYSDPMSSPKLASIEGDINTRFGALKEAVLSANSEAVAAEGAELLILIKERNTTCKMFK